MSQTLTNALLTYKAQQEAAGEPVILDQIVFALIPGLDPEVPVDPDETLPPDEQIQYRYDIPDNNKGFINPNAVVYSCLLGTDIGTWNYNAIYLINKDLNLAGTIIHEPEQTKVKADPTGGIEGDTITRNIVTPYENAQQLTQINVSADTWQLDFNVRLSAMDERVRENNTTEYRKAAFIDDGWKVSHTAGEVSATVTPGTGYSGGLKAVLDTTYTLDLTGVVFPKTVYIVTSFEGQANSAWTTNIKLQVEDSLQEESTIDGITYYASPLALLSSDQDAEDLRTLSRTDEKLKNLDLDLNETVTQMLSIMRKVEGRLGRVRIYQNTTLDEDYLAIDGSTINKTDYPDYFDYLGITDETLTLPNWKTHGYLRQFDDDIDPGSQLEQAILQHKHNASSNSTGGHAHTINNENLGIKQTNITGKHSHYAKYQGGGNLYDGILTGNDKIQSGTAGVDTAGEHSHTVDLGEHGHSMNNTGTHSHTITVDNTGGEENRPNTTVVVYAVKVKYLVPSSL